MVIGGIKPPSMVGGIIIGMRGGCIPIAKFIFMGTGMCIMLNTGIIWVKSSGFWGKFKSCPDRTFSLIIDDEDDDGIDEWMDTGAQWEDEP